MSRRIAQLNSLIQRELGQAILQEIDLPSDTLVTITKVQTAADLSQAKIWISVLPAEKRDLVLTTLQKNKSKLQSFLNFRLRLRKIPQIKFVLDLSEEKAERINELLDEITNKG